MKPVSIRDIARQLNLSITTVSRALDGYPDVSNRTRLRVLETASQMGYVPNQAARQLRRKKTDVIGFVLATAQPKFSDPIYSEFLSGLADEATTVGMDLRISIAPPDTDEEKNIYKRWSRSHEVDGIILSHVRVHDWRVRFLQDEALPFAGFDKSDDNIDYPHCASTNEQAMQQIVTHLAQAGYKRIAFIGGPENYVSHQTRYAGFMKGLEYTKLPVNPSYFVNGDLSSSSGYILTKSLIELDPAPDAIVCINDQTAFGVLHALHEKKIIPGKDIAVTGFGGVQESKYCSPPLTTIDIPIYDITRQLVRTLLGVIRKEENIDYCIPANPQLIIRETTNKETSP
jgi:LacI family transcriptional regulator